MSEERATYNAGPIRPECFNPFPIWERPTVEEIRSLLTMLDLSNSQIAYMVGVNDGKQVRRWKSGQAQIPFGAWGILASHAGHPSCIDGTALEFNKRPRLQTLIKDISSIDIHDGTTTLKQFGGGGERARLVVDYHGINDEGLDVVDTIRVDTSGMSNIEIVKLITEKIEDIFLD